MRRGDAVQFRPIFDPKARLDPLRMKIMISPPA